MKYTAFVLTEDTRDLLVQKFKPKYPDIITHHITHKFDASASDLPEPPQKIKVTGYHEGDYLDVLTVEIDGCQKQETRIDGIDRYYHITLSLDRSQGVEPKDSNHLIQKIVQQKGEAALQNLDAPVLIHAQPELLERQSKVASP